MRTQSFAGGMLEGQDTPEGFAINRVMSTDPSVYLNPALAPGQIYSSKDHPLQSGV